MPKWIGVCLVIMVLVESESFAQAYHIDVGIRSQKTFGLYLENGVASQFTLEQLAYNKLYCGVGFVTSRLGSAWGSNAIRQDNYQLWIAYYFREERDLRPFFSLNTGYFVADYEEEMFEVLDNRSILLSGSSGLEYTFPVKLKLNAQIGYNLITGNGLEGPGTLYPLYVQFTAFYQLR